MTAGAERAASFTFVPKDSIDLPTRRRIVAHLVRYLEDVRASDPDFTVRALAEKLGVTESHLSRILSGDRQPGLDLVLRMNRKLYISADLLLNHDPTSKKKQPR